MDFIKLPFAVDGDRATIPEPTQPTGNVSFQEGFGDDYAKDLETDPSAKNIPRDVMNGILYAATKGVRDWQTQGIPDFITSAMNGGSPFPYGLGACILWTDGHPYRSKIANNTTDPTNTTNWEKTGSVTWQNIPGKPVIVAEGVDKPAARESIGVRIAEAADYSNLETGSGVVDLVAARSSGFFGIPIDVAAGARDINLLTNPGLYDVDGTGQTNGPFSSARPLRICVSSNPAGTQVIQMAVSRGPSTSTDYLAGAFATRSGFGAPIVWGGWVIPARGSSFRWDNMDAVPPLNITHTFYASSATANRPDNRSGNAIYIRRDADNSGGVLYVTDAGVYSRNYAAGVWTAWTPPGSGTWPGAYTGTTQNNVAFPIGSTVLVTTTTAVSARNSTIAVYLNTSNEWQFTTVAGTQLTGTWRVRGWYSGAGAGNICLAERVA